jgi:hypothetical protein
LFARIARALDASDAACTAQARRSRADGHAASSSAADPIASPRRHVARTVGRHSGPSFMQGVDTRARAGMRTRLARGEVGR